MSHLTARIIAAMALLAILPSPGKAAPSRQFTQVGPVTGTIITDSHPSYDAATQRLTIAGRVNGLTAAQMANFRVYVQGIQGTMVHLGGVSASFSAAIPFGETYFGGVAFPWWFPYAGAYAGDYHLAQPILVELVDRNLKVHARSRVVPMDARYNPGFGQGDTDIQVIDGLAGQMTAAAFDILEPTHLSTLPYPSLSVYNDDLNLEVQDLTPPLSTTLTDGCFPIDQEPQFKDTDAYGAVVAEALLQYGEYLVAKETYDAAVVPAVKLAAWATMQSICVHDNPIDHPDDYQVCVNTLEGELTDASLSGVSSVDLSLVDGSIESDVVLDRVDATAEMRLRDLRIEWTKKPQPVVCVFNAETEMDNLEITSTEWLDEWATCDDAEVDAGYGTLVSPVPFGVEVSLLSDEELDVQDQALPDFELHDWVHFAGYQTCSGPDFVVDATAWLMNFDDDLERVVTNAWETGVTGRGEDTALDLLIHPLDVGVDPLTWYDAYVTYGLLDVREEAGLAVRYDPAVVALEWTGDGLAWTFDVYPPPLSEDGLDELGDPFDVAYSMTTPFLTRVVATLADGFLDFDWAPTCGELGIDPVAWCGGDPDIAPDLKGDLLAAVSPGLASIGGNRVWIHVSHEMTPLIWMHQDPPAANGGEVPLVYDIPSLKITISGEPVVGAVETVYLEARLDFHDEDLVLGWTGAFLGEPVGSFTVLRSTLAGCGPIPHIDSPRNDPTSCERTLEADLYEVFFPEIRRRAAAMVAELPGLQIFDAEGEGSPGLEPGNPNLRWQQDNYVTLYGDLQ